MHSYWPKAGGENFAHESLITIMNCHLLVKVADMLHGISSPIVNGESWLGKLMREPGLVDSPNKR